MQQALLRTKLHPPQLAQSTIPRPHLLTLLDQGLAGKATLVSAPAGFGKSSLVVLWLDYLLQGDSPPARAVKASWLALDARDSHPLRFLRYVVGAIRTSFPNACPTVDAYVDAAQPPPLDYLAETLANELADLPGRLILVLDDLHEVTEAATYTLLERLIDYAPPQVHCVLISRTDPTLPLARWRARGHLAELRTPDLRFTLAETTTFLQDSLAERPDEGVITALHEQTEGWAVGLRMAILSLRQRQDYQTFVVQLAAQHNRYTIDYLLDEVLAGQPAPIQHFLLCTAILPRFCAALCAVVVAGISEAAAQEQIRYLAQANLFLIDLSVPPLWYRYHHQFQSALQSRLYEHFAGPQIAELHRRAGAWFAAQGELDEALHHFRTIGDDDAMANTLEQARFAALNAQRYLDLERWLALVPAAVMAQRPLLLITQAWVDHFRVAAGRCVARASAVGHLLQSQPTILPPATLLVVQAEVDTLLAFYAGDLEVDQRFVLTQRAGASIQGQLDQTHVDLLVFLAADYRRCGQIEEALTLIAVALDSAVDWRPSGQARLLVGRSTLHIQRGHYALAALASQQTLQLALLHKLAHSAAWAEYCLGVCTLARNQLALAESHHLAVVERYMESNYRVAVLSIFDLISIYTAQGQPEKVEPYLAKLAAYGQVTANAFLMDEAAALEARLALASGDLGPALYWARSTAHEQMYTQADCRQYIQTEVLLAAGLPDDLRAADQLLRKQHTYFERTHDLHRLVSVLVLQALVWAKLGQRETALHALGQAVQLTVPAGRIRPFIEQGALMAQLLAELGKTDEYAYQVETLLAVFPPVALVAAPTPRPAPPSVELVELLSNREQAVLPLLAKGLTNQEIAAELVISVHTVRNHTINIYNKLGVDNRRQAIAKTRRLGWSPDP